MNDQSQVAAHDAATIGAPPGGDTPRFVRATVLAVNETSYLLQVKIGDGTADVSYNPLAYIPRKTETQEPGVWLAVIGDDPKNWWVMGVASRDLSGRAEFGRPPSAALRCDSKFAVEHGTQGHLLRVNMTGADWDTDKMIPDSISADHPTTKITLRRTGLYTIKAGGRWAPRSTTGRRGMDLRWAGTEIVIARDEKGANDERECAHSVSVDVMITDIDPTSPRVRKLPAAVELVVYQTSGDKLDMAAGAFLQVTYQGPKP
jgi:hypothetical protein